MTLSVFFIILSPLLLVIVIEYYNNHVLVNIMLIFVLFFTSIFGCVVSFPSANMPKDDPYFKLVLHILKRSHLISSFGRLKKLY